MSPLNALQQPSLMPIVYSIAAVGTGLIIPYVYRFSSFIWLYYLRPSSINRYVQGPPTCALVTGASDGINKAVATELYDKGFNIIIHGRTEDKVRRIAEEIRARGPRDVRYLIADASKPGHGFSALMEPFKELNLTVIVHNVGGSIRTRKKTDGCAEDALVNVVHLNDIFPLLLTRTLLPSLRASARHGPVMVQFVGSHASQMAAPRMALYSAFNACLESLARGLDLDERVWEATGVRFAYLTVGAPTLWMPSSERFAQAQLVARISCGRKAYAPYMWRVFLRSLEKTACIRAVVRRSIRAVVRRV
ncbi:NAD-P-binding protein [Amylocystis lapponica]|nr:NAD-P-binding protein [Amylocystis lapponica]